MENFERFLSGWKPAECTAKLDCLPTKRQITRLTIKRFKAFKTPVILACIHRMAFCSNTPFRKAHVSKLENEAESLSCIIILIYAKMTKCK